MESWTLTREQARVAIASLMEVARADGRFDELERELVSAAAEALGEPDLDLEALAPIGAEEVAVAVDDALARTRLVQAMIVCALVDGEASREEAALIARFASTLGVDDRRVANLHDIAEGHLLRVQIDVLRRFPVMRQMVRQALAEKGARWLFRSFRILQGWTHDAELAWRYKKLGLMPAGTLGRAFWESMTRWGLPFPGEPHGLNEYIAHHDLTHVLAGYGVEPGQEILVAAFTAGMRREDPFALVFATTLSFHLGIRIQPIAPGSRGNFHPREVVHALERGLATQRDLSDGTWDYWSVMDRPIDELRAEYGIPPLDEGVGRG